MDEHLSFIACEIFCRNYGYICVNSKRKRDEIRVSKLFARLDLNYVMLFEGKENYQIYVFV